MPPQLGLVVDRAVLAAAVRMVGQPSRRASDREGLSQCGERQFLVQAVADRPADNAPGKQVDDNGQIQPALPGPDVGDIRAPLLIGALGREVLVEEVGRDREGMKAVGGAPEAALAAEL